MIAEYQRRRDALVEGLNSLGWSLEKPRGTFYVWAPIPPSFGSSAEFTHALLHDCGILTTPGPAYGTNGEGYIRFSLTIPDAGFMETAVSITVSAGCLQCNGEGEMAIVGAARRNSTIVRIVMQYPVRTCSKSTLRLFSHSST